MVWAMKNFYREPDPDFTPFPVLGQEVATPSGTGVITYRRLNDRDWARGVEYEVRKTVTGALEWFRLEELDY